MVTRWRAAGPAVVRYLTFCAIICTGSIPARAQEVETDPVECWWRTSTSAIRVGQVFTAVLTCAFVDTGSTTVVIDRSRLEPTVAALPPFEVVGGEQPDDVRSAEGRTFFQYEYRLRLIRDAPFDRDVLLPEMRLAYRVRTTAGSGAAVDGMERFYELPTLPLRVLSLVPDGASDIRDSSATTFADVETREVQANVLVTAGTVLSALGAVLGLVGVAAGLSSRRAPTAGHEPVADVSVLRAASRELSSVGRARQTEGWTPELVGRGLAALRIVGAYAAERPASQRVNVEDGASPDGAMVFHAGALGTSRVIASGAATARTLAQIKRNGTAPTHEAILDTLQEALSAFTQARYGHDQRVDEPALDEGVAAGRRAAARLSFSNRRLVKKIRTVRRRVAGLGRRMWAR
jgi:hypothetical protein